MHRLLRWSCLCAALFVCSIFMSQCKGGNCFVLCEVGLSICKLGQVQTCMTNPNTNCLEWRIQTCPAGQTCAVSNVGGKAVAQCSGDANCTDKRAKRKCVGNEVYYFDNCDRQREKVTICKSECKNGLCVGEGCNECNAGDRRCTSDGWLSFCSRSPTDNCFRWDKPISCPEGQVCLNNKCEKGECPKPCVVGEYRCQGKSLQSCAKAKSGCDDWGPIYPCPEGDTCKEGKCVKEICPESCKIDADCDIKACDKRKACDKGKCIEPVGPCTDDCKSGESRCDGVKLQICRKGTDGCFDWALPTDCLAGQICKDGSCVQEPCPNKCTKDEDCQKAACGAKKSCIKGVCDIPEQVCPSSCSNNSECDIPNCLTKRACISGKCSNPSESTPDGGSGEAIPETAGETPSDTRTLWKYGNNVSFSTRNKTNTKTDAKWGPVLTDIINHENPNDPNNQTDPMARAMGVLRGIHAKLRSDNTSGNNKKAGLYVLQGRTAILPEPNMTKDKVAAFVPAFVKTGSSARFSNFVTGSSSWNDRPLFLYDEWVVHTLAFSVALDQHDNGLATGAQSANGALDVIEFTIYVLATAMAIKQHDATYFANQKQFLEFTAWGVAEAFRILYTGQRNSNFTNTKADDYLKKLRTHNDAKAMRDFCKTTFGQQWLTDVIRP